MYDLKEDFQQEVMKTSLAAVVVAYFTAPWCVPCKMLRPRLEQIEENYDPGVVFVIRVDVESFPELADRFQIKSVPTLLFFAGGEQVAELTGAKQNKEIQAIIDRFKE